MMSKYNYSWKLTQCWERWMEDFFLSYTELYGHLKSGEILSTVSKPITNAVWQCLLFLWAVRYWCNIPTACSRHETAHPDCFVWGKRRNKSCQERALCWWWCVTVFGAFFLLCFESESTSQHKLPQYFLTVSKITSLSVQIEVDEPRLWNSK